MNVKSFIQTINEGMSLDTAKSEALFDAIFDGKISEIELAAILIAMKIRRETAKEIVGAVRSMRKFALKPEIADFEPFDTCGTGGDGSHSFNISTAVSIILNTLGIAIAKHGNRSVSSQSGSADFLEALKIPISLETSDATEYFHQHRFLFLFAPDYHPAMKHAVPVRRALGVRTIFNFLGPLTNPASPRRQVIGVFHPDFLPLYTEVVSELSFERVLLYSAINGMDEVSPIDTTIVYDIRGTEVSTFPIDPKNYLSPEEAASIPTHLSPAENASHFLDCIQSLTPTPLGKLLALNTALALYALDRGQNLERNYQIALDSIHSGEVSRKVQMLQGVQ
jgi:anthranilate phosphoribosyltransferase